MQHDWIKSTLGHGETMCSRCFVTNREAAAIGMVECGVQPPAPKATNDNAVAWLQEDIDHECIHDDDEEDGGAEEEECGRWDNGRLGFQCSKAGSEECDWICPIGLPRS
jgi:hypothetical protein